MYNVINVTLYSDKSNEYTIAFVCQCPSVYCINFSFVVTCRKPVYLTITVYHCKDSSKYPCLQSTQINKS